MQNTLTDLFNGRIYPAEKSIKDDPEQNRLLHEIIALEQELAEKLGPEQELLEKLLQLENQRGALREQELFIEGYRLATRLMVEGLCRQSDC